MAWFHLTNPPREYMLPRAQASDIYALLGKVRYSSAIHRIAEAVVSWLGLFNYTALHLRGNDFQFAAEHSARDIVAKTKALLVVPHDAAAENRDGRAEVVDRVTGKMRLYVAIDHVAAELRREWAREGVEVVTWADFRRGGRWHAPVLAPVLAQLSLNSGDLVRVSGMVEQLVCAFADTFVGSARSTFTAMINRIRQYARVPVPAIAVHSSRASEHIGGLARKMREDWRASGGWSAERASAPVDLYKVRCWPAGDCLPFPDLRD
eukprot:TRINITY_DN15917_c0_g1_i1.p2 TRINITY_DN15917_c0_g1~~TRINITY_DN15917_c0_g1_i1.p2  ORF type:complete len:264 (+),score=58.05 TRINITY_DN15917_c0_g1_i1:751-1542(+)